MQQICCIHNLSLESPPLTQIKLVLPLQTGLHEGPLD